MPKLYEYLGIVIFFYSNDTNPFMFTAEKAKSLLGEGWAFECHVGVSYPRLKCNHSRSGHWR